MYDKRRGPENTPAGTYGMQAFMDELIIYGTSKRNVLTVRS
jgi:hypothetical protein